MIRIGNYLEHTYMLADCTKFYMKTLLILLLLIPSLSWGKEISLTCSCDERVKTRNGNEEIKNCEGTVDIIINEKEKTMNFVGIGTYDYTERGNFIYWEKKYKPKNGDFDLILENRSIDRVNGNLHLLAIFNTPSEVISYSTKSLCKLTKDIDKLF